MDDPVTDPDPGPVAAPVAAAVDAPVAVVTGAAQGIGLRIANVLADAGYRLALFDLQPVPGFRAAVQVIGDVTDETAVATLDTAVQQTYGRVDVLVNNAGIACISPAEQTPVALWRQVLEVNLTGPFLLCQIIGRRMLAQGSGSIINIASVAGLLGVSDRAAYNTSKHGLIGLTRTLAVEWGGRGVRVNAVCPGWVKTPMDDALKRGCVWRRGHHRPRAARPVRHPRRRRSGRGFPRRPSRSGFVNGTALSVDGGWHSDGSWQSVRLGARSR
jgi:NAD(P)-dependent dehydrogenase (short-subunit alcohol dehydrogenase family)